ncbi:aminoglycoside 6-adenylyltransferase [Dictyobacter formicarum]|uniref:Aminoglycoside adenylyltransferase n=1 Tax=Dictyobacter formicarum TaxID=2778368 RepID=A0ABQ3VBV5_9CHLR|nr:aminoglycoside 6-adenylyltransferase [Dictyobacter formicarum]GHO83637.1 hypothetical protein KSZ_16430 [Dictyobacter formicarum]
MMEEANPRSLMRQRILAAVEMDPRVVGVLDYGSGSRSQEDMWSDLDLAVFIEDAAFEDFSIDWKRWAAQFGELLLAYQGAVGHPWTVYEAETVPLRVDFAFHRASVIEQVITELLHRPRNSEDMVLYDQSQGRIVASIQYLLAQIPAVDVSAIFEQAAGDFWYFLLLVFSKWQRGQGWLARQTFHLEVMQNLLTLLRLESQAFERWQETSVAWNIEQTCSARRLAQLDTCIPGIGRDALRQGLVSAAVLGYEVCTCIATEHALPWPQAVADRTLSLLKSQL